MPSQIGLSHSDSLHVKGSYFILPQPGEITNNHGEVNAVPVPGPFAGRPEGTRNLIINCISMSGTGLLEAARRGAAKDKTLTTSRLPT